MIKLKNGQVLSDLTIDALHAEAIRAHHKHVNKGGSLLDPAMTDLERLAALMEEVGEVARCLTYDGDKDPDKFEQELIQVMNIAGTWLQSRHVEEVATVE